MEISPLINFLSEIFVIWVVGEIIWPSKFWFKIFDYQNNEQVTFTEGRVKREREEKE